MIKKFETELFDASNAYAAALSVSNRNTAKREKAVYTLWIFEDIVEILAKFNKRYNEQYNEILKKYGQRGDVNDQTTGRPIWDITPVKRDEFDTKIEELKAVKVEFSCETLFIEDLIDLIDISGGEIRPLRKIGILKKKQDKKGDGKSN